MASVEDNSEIEKSTAVVEGPVAISIPKETLDFFGGDEIRARVFFEKYSMKDDDGKPLELTPVEMWNRISREISSVEADDAKRADWKEKFYWLLSDFKFVPGGRIMYAAGQKRASTLLNCYVLPIKEDSIEAIFDWCKEAARTYKYGGGAGVDISVLRPKNTVVHNAAMTSTGAVSFMEIMSETSHTIGQAGRRGALMITMDVGHPDILDFIRVKQNLKKVRYANISVKMTDDFMRAVEHDEEFTLSFENKRVNRIDKKVKAKEVWNELVNSARDWAEPGILFWDTIKRYSPSEYNGMEVISTNPCSEQPLQAYGACDLGSINLSAFVLEPFTDNTRFDWANFEKSVRYSVRFLDDVLDYNADKHPLKEQADAVGKSRRIGLGVTGLADMLAKLKIKYDSEDALKFVDKLFESMKNTSYDESTEIAKEKGSFSLFDKEKHLSMNFVKTLNDDIRKKIETSGLRNVALLTIPPVGSGSVLVGSSSGMEPIFAFSYTRRSESLSKEYFKVYHPLVMQYMQISGITDDSKLPDFFVQAYAINPEFKVRMQGIIQKHVDSAISSTVNLPKEATAEQVGNIYMMAWKTGCKGITVYREGSREGILTIESEETKKKPKEEVVAVEVMGPRVRDDEWKRPQAMIGKTVKLKMQQVTLYITVNFDERGMIKEVFVNAGNTGSQEKSYTEALGRLISMYLQLNGDVKDIIGTLKGIKATDSITWDRGIKLYSVPDAIAKALEIAMGTSNFKLSPLYEQGKESAEQVSGGYQLGVGGSKESTVSAHGHAEAEVCPKCNEHTLVYEGGCYICKSCSFTKCS